MLYLPSVRFLVLLTSVYIVVEKCTVAMYNNTVYLNLKYYTETGVYVTGLPEMGMQNDCLLRNGSQQTAHEIIRPLT